MRELLTIWQAKALAQKGQPVTHKLFTPGEHVVYKDGKLIDECEVELPEDEFWELRKQGDFMFGWSLTNLK